MGVSFNRHLRLSRFCANYQIPARPTLKASLNRCLNASLACGPGDSRAAKVVRGHAQPLR
ncbi:hypothetical protein [Paraburkholderia phosphatilytica]|uniref:hypothetical protein n=1 Tax=Paraburkholderia phosphatilytica TaxID=2282883 RepID=UPI000F5F78F5|nr:hypothetical protein [Paraburkholderia phosphatilytica]